MLAQPQTVQLAQQLEPHRMFFLEDSLRPEWGEHFRILRQHTTAPSAAGRRTIQTPPRVFTMEKHGPQWVEPATAEDVGKPRVVTSV